MQYWDFEIDLTSASGTAVAAETTAAGGGSLWGMILEAILWGFAALLTPCVFPMVPMTVSFFLKGSENKARGRFRAGMYGLFIILLYTLPIAALIIITRWLGGDAVTADIFNWLATHWLPNIIFFIVFMIFAASFFGAFDITMPSKLVNKTDTKSDKGGLGGNHSIRDRIDVLATKGYIKFNKEGAAKSKYGMMCVEGMEIPRAEPDLDPQTGEITDVMIPLLPTHFKQPNDGAILPVENPEIWVYHDGGEP